MSPFSRLSGSWQLAAFKKPCALCLVPCALCLVPCTLALCLFVLFLFSCGDHIKGLIERELIFQDPFFQGFSYFPGLEITGQGGQSAQACH